MKPGTRLGTYEIVGSLGAGGMGEVYRAHDPELDRDVAVKVLPADLSHDAERLDRLRREARALASLNHSNLATVHGFEDHEGVRFIVMELVEGPTLTEKLEEGPLPAQEVLEIAVEMARALEAAHERGIVHRDLKPDNVKITPAGEVKVLDFGLAKSLRTTGEGSQSEFPTATAEPTLTGAVMGTAPYMSPEQARGKKIDERTDIWAFGCVLYEMIAGDRAFPGETASDSVAAILRGKPDWAALPRETPPPVRRLLRRMLAKDLEKRLRHIADARIELQEILEDAPIPAPELEKEAAQAAGTAVQDATGPATEARAARSPRRRAGWLTLGIVAALVALTAGAGSWYLLRPGGESDRTARSIAVLPFDNIGENPEHQAFVEGIHDGVLTELSRIAELTVISRTSVMQYADTLKEIPSIARELGVSSVLEGTVQQVGDRVRVAVRLVDGRRDVRLWSENYDRELTAENVFAIQSDLARNIAAQLHARLSPEEADRVEVIPTTSLEAYRLYVRGRALLDQRTAPAMRQAVSSFEQAIETDAAFAQAWAGVADALALLESYGHAQPGSLLPRAVEAAERALEIDPDLAEALASLSLVYSLRSDGPAGLRHLRRAVEVRPSYAEAHNWLSWVNCLLGDPSQALARAERSVELNPLSPEAVSNLALSHLVNDDPARALVAARRVQELQPGYTTGDLYEGLSLYHLGRIEEAGTIVRGLTVPWTGRGAEAFMALVHVATDEPEQARRMLSPLQQEDDPFNLGLVHAALGEEDLAFDAFQDIERWGDWPTLVIRYFFPEALAGLRDDPRYPELLRRVDRSWNLEG